MHFETVLDFWLGPASEDIVDETRQNFWFRGSKEDDALIKGRFMHYLLAASKKELDNWLSSSKGRLALIIILDQFSRNIFRGAATAYLYDAQALQVAKEGIYIGQDHYLSIPERSFFYMPYQHAENLEDQKESLRLYQELLDSAQTPEEKKFAENALDYARQHHDIIKRFGRFPHRNKVLLRQSTEQELAYLSSGASRFGQ